MSFVPVPPVLPSQPRLVPPSLRRTTFLPSLSPPFGSAPRPPHTLSVPVAALPNDFFRAMSDRFSNNSTPSPSREYRTMSSSAAPDLTSFLARVVQVTPVCHSAEHVQLTLDVSDVALVDTHVAPGQFVQLRRDDNDNTRRRRPSNVPQTCFATIASSPGGCDGCFEVLLNKRRDPLKLAAMKVGDPLRISPVMGKGLDYLSVVKTDGDLYMFVDAPQGFAAVKSLIEWGVFRSLSGEGANRTNHITIYYAVPTGRSLPYADRFSSWSVFGVNVTPLPGTSVLEYLSTVNSLGRSGKPLTECFAMACVTSNDTFEALFSLLILYGFRRSAIQRFTQEVIAREVTAPDDGKDFEMRTANRKSAGMPDDAYQGQKRDTVEQEIWQSWVRVREGMRAEFERKWAAQSRVHRENKRSEAEKQQAWASWCARNKEQWTQVAWDSDSWGKYWSSWKETNQTWTSKTGSWDSGSSSSAKYGQNGYSWSQQNSQEYWDWVGRGTRREGASPHPSSSGNGTGRSYQKSYGSSPEWGSTSNRWSGYQKGGYRYQYEEPKKEESSNRSHSGGYTAGGNTGSQTGWSGWKRGTSGQRASANGGQRKWNTGKQFTFGDLDFYGILGIDSGASRADIKRAYRRKAMEHHPDRNLDKSEEAHVMMKQIVVAWSVLKDDEKRRKYDAFGPGGL